MTSIPAMRGWTEHKPEEFTGQPLNDRLVLKVDLAERVTAGGIIVPDSAKSVTRNRGTVVAVGKGEVLTGTGQHRPPEVKPGDRVMFTHHAGTWIDDEKTLLLIRECDVIAVLEGEGLVMEENKYNVDPREVV